MKETPFEMHEHCYVTGPNATAGYRADGKWHESKFSHAHADGSRGHRHPDTGPASFQRAKHKKYTAKPNGPQLPFVERTAEESIFHVVFIDEYTAAHRTADISPERFAAERQDFIDVMNSDGALAGLTEDRLIQRFDLTPIYELRKPDD